MWPLSVYMGVGVAAVSVHGCGCGRCQCTWVWVWPLSVYMGVGVAAVSVHGCGCGHCQCTWVWVWPLSVYMSVGVAAVSVHGCGCDRCQCTWVCVWPLSVYMGVGVAAVSVLCLLLLQTCAWWEGQVHMRGVWRSTTMAPGGLCAVMAGTCVMPQWSVVKWATSRQQLSWGLHGLVQAEVPSCSVNCPALATRASSLSVVMATVLDSTAATVKTSALCMKVSHCVGRRVYLHLLFVCYVLAFACIGLTKLSGCTTASVTHFVCLLVHWSV